MVVESLTSLKDAENKHGRAFLLGALYTTIAVFLSLWVFKSYASLVMVFFIVLAATPLVYSAIKEEEKKDVAGVKERTLLREHANVVYLLLFLFAGVVIASSFWYSVLPSDTVNLLFSVQMKTISNINTNITGRAAGQIDILAKIILNNLKVTFFCILFAFIYGVGSIFILAWNSTVIGAAVGNFIRSNLSQYSVETGFYKAGAYLHIVSLGLAKYAVHGIPEMVAYFIAGLAGGIISVAVANFDFRTKNFHSIIIDVSDLMIISLFFLVVAALLEVYVTPLLF